MSETIAEMLKREGREEERILSLRTVLLRQLRKRFKEAAAQARSPNQRHHQRRRLQTWLDNLVDARTLADVGVPME